VILSATRRGVCLVWGGDAPGATRFGSSATDACTRYLSADEHVDDQRGHVHRRRHGNEILPRAERRHLPRDLLAHEPSLPSLRGGSELQGTVRRAAAAVIMRR
jgi:hypothetical protein